MLMFPEMTFSKNDLGVSWIILLFILFVVGPMDTSTKSGNHANYDFSGSGTSPQRSRIIPRSLDYVFFSIYVLWKLSKNDKNALICSCDFLIILLLPSDPVDPKPDFSRFTNKCLGYCALGSRPKSFIVLRWGPKIRTGSDGYGLGQLGKICCFSWMLTNQMNANQIVINH